jgi:hypothetical protein
MRGAAARGRGVAVIEQGGVELVEVLRWQPVEAVRADAGDEVLADGRLTTLQRPLSHATRADCGQPVTEPPADGRGGRLAAHPGVALALDLSDLGDHDAAARAADMPAVGLSFEREPDGDVVVPPPVGALVDRRLAALLDRPPQSAEQVAQPALMAS